MGNRTWLGNLGYVACGLAFLLVIGSIAAGVLIGTSAVQVCDSVGCQPSYPLVPVAAGVAVGGLVQALILALLGGIAIRSDDN